ncbi:hypothetical protein ACFE04_031925 [Oxalis oulophora]
MAYENIDLNMKATELRLGLPGTDEREKQQPKNNKRASPDEDTISDNSNSVVSTAGNGDLEDNTPPAKLQVVGWPPIRSYRKNNVQPKKNDQAMYVKVSVDGAPFLRKIDLNVYNSYQELLKALEKMFKLRIGEYSEREGYDGSDYAPTYEDKDGDWMLVGDVPWNMFICSCKKLRIMKGSEARGLGCL